ncbi:unnamed protein product [Clonostachys rosea f. rosea IK726]|uniref:Peptidase S8/S53 domain-containing protein n=2 Tax=Bionectria ochroleuca TaxID=29856 RepID=A0A0B7KEZ8_BIOOC|nr:unnamed protein product [Clonostachys rosea f. rosea IK726]
MWLLVQDTSEFFSTLSDSGQNVTPALNFSSTLFEGASFDLAHPSEESVEEIQSLPEVEKIWPAALFSIPVVGKASSVDNEALASYSVWNAHNETNVAAMHKKGHLGKGIIIATVDSGIDYTHPALGGGFGPGFRVESGYDLVGDDYVVGGPYAPDSDPMDCLGHGTHVAGIAASSDALIPGVAPEARLRSYKVFGCGDGVYEDVIIAAFIQAHEEGADVINASLGSNRGFTEQPIAIVVSKIAAEGVFVSVAAGNSGDHGSFYTSSGGNGLESFAVGSAEAQNWVTYNITATSTSNETRSMTYISDNYNHVTLDGSVQAYAYPNARDVDACNWSLASTPKDTALFIRKGDCVWQIQDSTLVGLTSSVFYIQKEGVGLERPGRIRGSDNAPENSALVLYEDGDWILKQFEAGHNVTLHLSTSSDPVAVPKSGYVGGRINDYSSWGPTLDGRMKPEVSAPGGTILSTYPVSKGSWAVLSGTSMAAPYMAGVGALFFSSRGGREALGGDSVKVARDRVIASARLIKHNDGSGNEASVGKQGAGLIDVQKIIESGTTISPAYLELNDTVHFSGSHEVVLTNSNDDSVTYKLTHQPGITTFTFTSSNAWVALEPKYSTAEDDVAKVSMSAEEVVLDAKASVTVKFDFTEPAAPDSSLLPVYGGKVLISGSNGEVVLLTYLGKFFHHWSFFQYIIPCPSNKYYFLKGIKGSIYDAQSWEMDRGVPLLLSGYGGVMEEGHVYTYEDGSDVPQPYFNILWSTREMSFDFVRRDWQPSDWTYPTVAGKNNWVGSIRMRPNGLSGEVVDFPLQNYPRQPGGAFYAASQGYFANGSYIYDGEYRYLCRTLRTFGDYNNITDWQYKLSPWFSISRDPSVSSTSTTITPSATTSSAITTSTSAAPVCTPGYARPVSIKGSSGQASAEHELYLYSDFLAVDLSDSQPTHLDWKINSEGRFETSINGNTVYLAVHTNSNSLVYIYPASKITGSWSYLECTTSGNVLSCKSGEKDKFYTCGSDLLRHGSTVLDGCEALTLKTGPAADPCSVTTTDSQPTPTPTPTITNAPASSTTATRRPCIPRSKK